MASILHRLRLTLFHAGHLEDYRRPPRRQPVSVTGWALVAPGFAEAARRYVEQVALTLRPASGQAHRAPSPSLWDLAR